ncbi:MAG: hypothetical protein H0T46_37655 [Deltaproteobacteria bacterium]|nr:hypothetical protein [Deltaproteobacteria bacterium]
MKNLAWITSALAALSACGDNIKPEQPLDSGVDSGLPADASPDAPSSFTKPTPFAVPLSATGPDQLQSATAGPNGMFYAAGYAAATVSGPKLVTVVRLTSTGMDTTFGQGGKATTTLDFKGGGGEIDVATQSDGKIIVTTTVANLTNPADRDIAVIRLTSAGVLDTGFGVGGIRLLDLSTAFDNNGTLTGFDASRDLAIDAQNRIYVYGVQRGEGNITGGTTPRTDTDFAVVRLTANGDVDLGWGGGDGKYLQDIYSAGAHSNATSRGILALADGSVIAGGYANSAGLGTVQPVLFKLTPAGALDTGFADQGMFHDTVLALQTEIYNVALHGTKIVTGGYGRNAGTANDWISMRFDANTGVRDLAWGTTNGAVVFDPSGTMAGSNCRTAIALPGGRTLLTGSFGPSNMPAQDAVFAILDGSGKLDTRFGTGIVSYQLGSNGNDQFWGAAAAGTSAMVVGYKGGGAAQTDTVNDDSYGVFLPLP